MKVNSATRSPLNPLRWSCGLACGHSVWVTLKRLSFFANHAATRYVAAAPRKARCPECEPQHPKERTP